MRSCTGNRLEVSKYAVMRREVAINLALMSSFLNQSGSTLCKWAQSMSSAPVSNEQFPGHTLFRVLRLVVQTRSVGLGRA
jgi:hypothetical protein